MREPGWFDAFVAACAHAAGEPFYRGGGSSGWVADLGWLLKPGNAEKTAERAATQKAPQRGADSSARPGAPVPAMQYDGGGEVRETSGGFGS